MPRTTPATPPETAADTTRPLHLDVLVGLPDHHGRLLGTLLEAEAVTYHLPTRHDALAEDAADDSELFALALIAKTIGRHP